MKKYILFIALISFSVLSFTSCQKKDDTTPDPSKVTITVNNPQNGQVISQHDTLHIDASASYVTELHGYNLELTDSASGAVLFTADQDIHNDHFDIHETWVDTLSAPTTLQLKIVIEFDHDGHEADKTIKFYSRPH